MAPHVSSLAAEARGPVLGPVNASQKAGYGYVCLEPQPWETETG